MSTEILNFLLTSRNKRASICLAKDSVSEIIKQKERRYGFFGRTAEIFLRTCSGLKFNRPSGVQRADACPRKKEESRANGTAFFLVGAGGFEPPKSSTTDLQSAPFGHSGTLPYAVLEAVGMERGGAGRRTRTPDLLITNQLLYQLSYTSMISDESYNSRLSPICQPKFFNQEEFF